MENNLIFESIFNANINEMNVIPCKTGDVNSAYIVLYAGEKVFVKIQNKQNLPVFYNGQIEREVTGLKLCKENNIPCPSVLKYNYEQKYVVTEFLEHPLLSQVWDTLDNFQKMHIKQQTFDILKRLNSIESCHFGTVYPSDCQYDEWSDCYKKLIRIAVTDCLNYNSLTEEEAMEVLQTIVVNAQYLSKENACFNHLDLHWNNIFVENKGGVYDIAGIIDFGSALYTPAYMDLCRLDGGFLYGTEKFYSSEERPYILDIHQHFCSNILNTLDYFVFLSFTNRVHQNIKNNVMKICKEYLSKVR